MVSSGDAGQAGEYLGDPSLQQSARRRVLVVIETATVEVGYVPDAYPQPIVRRQSVAEGNPPRIVDPVASTPANAGELFFAQSFGRQAVDKQRQGFAAQLANPSRKGVGGEYHLARRNAPLRRLQSQSRLGVQRLHRAVLIDLGARALRHVLHAAHELQRVKHPATLLNGAEEERRVHLAPHLLRVQPADILHAELLSETHLCLDTFDLSRIAGHHQQPAVPMLTVDAVLLDELAHMVDRTNHEAVSNAGPLQAQSPHKR